jgi:hypothetical protein
MKRCSSLANVDVSIEDLPVQADDKRMRLSMSDEDRFRVIDLQNLQDERSDLLTSSKHCKEEHEPKFSTKNTKKESCIEDTVWVQRIADNESAFFIVMYSNDLWIAMKSHMNMLYKSFNSPSIRLTNYDDYKNGDSAVLFGYVRMIREKFDTLKFTEKAMTRAVNLGDFDTMVFLHQNGISCEDDTLGAAVWNYKHDMVMYLLDNYDRKWCIGVLYSAVRMGGRSVAKKLLKKNLITPRDVLDMVYCYDRPDFLGLVGEKVLQRCGTALMDYAATQGSFQTLIYLHERRKEGCTTKAMDNAASKGYLWIVKYLNDHRPEGCSEIAIHLAIQGFHFETAEYLCLNRASGSITTADSSRLTRWRPDILSLIREKGYTVSEGIPFILSQDEETRSILRAFDHACRE